LLLSYILRSWWLWVGLISVNCNHCFTSWIELHPSSQKGWSSKVSFLA